MLNKETTLALIGAGHWGSNYLKSCKGLANIKIGYVLARSKKTLDKLPAKYFKTTKIEDLLNKKDISGFVITSPTSTHFDLAKLLIGRNKNVLIEKPVTDSYKKTKILYNLSLKHPKATVMAGHIQLYDSNYLKLKRNIAKIGKIKTLKYEGLKSQVRKDVGIFWDWLPHPLYLFSDIINRIPKVISVKFIKPDNLKITVSFAKDAVGKIHVGWTYPTRERSFTVIGKNGKLSLSSTTAMYTPLQNELIAFAQCIRQKRQPQSNLKQALEVAKTISQIEKLLK